MSDRPLGLAFLGCGAATAMHSRTLRRFRARVRCSYASRTGETARGFARRFRGAGWFAGYDAAIASGDVDAVLVATPPHLHRDLTLAALAAGKHVIVEKPAFFTTAVFDEVAAAADAAGRRVFVAENYYYKPLARALRETIASGALGRILFLSVNALKHQEAASWRADPALAGGGALFEGGVHWMNFMGNLGLEVRAVHGYGPRQSRQRSSLVVFEYADGAIGTLLHSWEARSPLRGLRISRIYGTQGTATFESNGLFLRVAGTRRRFVLGGPGLAGYRAMFDDFLDALASGRDALFGLAGARRDHERLEAIGAHRPLPEEPT